LRFFNAPNHLPEVVRQKADAPDLSESTFWPMSSTSQAVSFAVKVQPNASKTCAGGPGRGVPKDTDSRRRPWMAKANEALIEFVARRLSIPKSMRACSFRAFLPAEK
jgi:hypothetical protein